MPRTILVEKTDRIYRNIKDYATVDELEVDVHLIKENEVISRISKSSEQFVHGIKVLMARNYSLNLGEETVKGMTEQARAGLYPSNAPVGYLNTVGPAGKRIIIPGPDTAPPIILLFELFANGKYSIREVISKLRSLLVVNLRGQWITKQRAQSDSEEVYLLSRRFSILMASRTPWRAVTNHW